MSPLCEEQYKAVTQVREVKWSKYFSKESQMEQGLLRREAAAR